MKEKFQSISAYINKHRTRKIKQEKKKNGKKKECEY
jgi:hypothetical protein